MKRKNTLCGVIIFAGVVLVGVVLFCNSTFLKYYRYIDPLARLNIKRNRMTLTTQPESLKDSVAVYWVTDAENLRVRTHDTVLIYTGGRTIAQIRDVYGRNVFVIEYNKIRYTKMGIWKIKPWSKHDYIISVRKRGNMLLIDWEISNREEAHRVCDTIRVD